MIYMLFEALGLLEPSFTVAALTTIILLFGFIFGLMYVAASSQYKSTQKNLGVVLLRDVRQAAQVHARRMDPVRVLVNPALIQFGEALFRRDGATYTNLHFDVWNSTVTLYAHRNGGPQTKKLTEYIDLPFEMFNPGAALTEAIWHQVMNKGRK